MARTHFVQYIKGIVSVITESYGGEDTTKEGDSRTEESTHTLRGRNPLSDSGGGGGGGRAGEEGKDVYCRVGGGGDPFTLGPRAVV